MAYGAPCGGNGRYARPAVRSGTRYVSMRGLIGRVAVCRPRCAPTRPRLSRDAGSNVGASSTGC
eukprot:3730139-Prymnesium_polylepis.1